MKHIIVSGRVQGVFFRESAKEAAERLGIRGVARNLGTGDVEILASGDRMSEFIRWCRKGPSAARVESVGITDVPDIGFWGFSVEASRDSPCIPHQQKRPAGISQTQK